MKMSAKIILVLTLMTLMGTVYSERINSKELSFVKPVMNAFSSLWKAFNKRADFIGRLFDDQEIEIDETLLLVGGAILLVLAFPLIISLLAFPLVVLIPLVSRILNINLTDLTPNIGMFTPTLTVPATVREMLKRKPKKFDDFYSKLYTKMEILDNSIKKFK